MANQSERSSFNAGVDSSSEAIKIPATFRLDSDSADGSKKAVISGTAHRITSGSLSRASRPAIAHERPRGSYEKKTKKDGILRRPEHRTKGSEGNIRSEPKDNKSSLELAILAVIVKYCSYCINRAVAEFPGSAAATTALSRGESATWRMSLNDFAVAMVTGTARIRPGNFISRRNNFCVSAGLSD